MSLSALGASLLVNIIAGKGVRGAVKVANRSGKETNGVGQTI